MLSTGKRKALKANTHPSRADQGFTLIELVVVMTMLAVLALTAMPAWQQFNRNMVLRGAALQFASLLRSAQLQAVEDGEERTISIDVDNGTYRLQPVAAAGTADSDGSAAENATTRATNSYEVPRTLPPNAHFSAVDAEANADNTDSATNAGDTTEETPTSTAVSFYPDGSADPLVIELTNDQRTYRIEVKKATGTVHVSGVSVPEPS